MSTNHTFQASISHNDLIEALDGEVQRLLSPVSLVLCCFLTLLAVAQSLAPGAQLLVAVIAAEIALLFGLYRLLQAQRLPQRYAHLAAAGVFVLLLLLWFTGSLFSQKPAHTLTLLLIFVGAGALLLKTRWFIGVLALGLAMWGGVAWGTSNPLWWEYGVTLLSAITLATVIHIMRLHSVQGQVALRTQNEARTAMLQRQTRQLGTLISAGQSIHAILDLDVLLNYVVDLIQEQFGHYFVGVFLPQEAGEYLVMRAGVGKPGQELIEQGLRFKIGEHGLISWVGEHRQPLCVNDVTQEPRYVQVAQVADTRSELVLPLLNGENFLGVLDIQSQELHAFGDDDVHVFASLADLVAIAVNNAQLYQDERSQRMLTESLYQISQGLSQTLDIQEIFAKILEQLLQIVDFDRGSVLLRSGDYVDIVAAYGFPEDSSPRQIRVPILKNDVFWQISESRRPLCLQDVRGRSDWQDVPGLPPARSWVGIPVSDTNQDVIGMLSLVREAPYPYTTEEIERALAFAGHTAIAIHNARLYSELAQAYEQLARLDRTKSDFIAVAAHELRTPLTVLLGFSQMLLKTPEMLKQPTAHEIIGKIYGSGVRLQTIVNTMIDMARIDSQTLEIYREPLRIEEMLEKVVADMQPALTERELHLELKSAPDLPRLEADPDELQKVFKHLLTNAIKYTPNGGQIVVTTSVVPSGYRNLPTPGLEIRVQDTGIGIDPEYQDLIFTKFYQTGKVALHSSGTTKFKGGGPGLGLAVSKGIVAAHGGCIWAESPGYDEETCPGSTFHVWLPLSGLGTKPLVPPPSTT